MGNGRTEKGLSGFAFGFREVFTDEEMLELSKNVNCVTMILSHI